MRPLTYTELSAPTEDSADSVMYPNEGVIELTRRARIREREIGELEAQLREIREFVIPNDPKDPHESLMSELRAWDRHSSANIETGGKLQAVRKEADDLRAKLAAAEHRAETFEWADAAKNKLVFEMEEQLAAAGERERGLRAALTPYVCLCLRMQHFDCPKCGTPTEEKDDGLDVIYWWCPKCEDWPRPPIDKSKPPCRRCAALAQPAERTEGERTDTERLDHLENEVDREMRDVNPKGYVSLFRRNEPITRESIDAAMEAEQ